MRQLKTPVVLFIFKRYSTIPEIFKILRVVQPPVMYIFSDGPRNQTEAKEVDKARAAVLKEIDWDCSIHTYFSEQNQGVFNEIALGARKVFAIEKSAIFLEDDNLPAISFFQYCEDMLREYESNPNVLWVCGTSYLENASFLDGDYCLTQQMLPCGWASWSSKFLTCYLTSFKSLDKKAKKMLKKSYNSKALFHQQLRNFTREKYREDHGMRYISWDYHMAFSLHMLGMYGIAPRLNQITNIGVDDCSIHGGKTMLHPNTSNFCGVKTVEFSFPLKKPEKLTENPIFERMITKKVLAPLYIRILSPITTFLKKIFKLYPDGSLSSLLRGTKK